MRIIFIENIATITGKLIKANAYCIRRHNGKFFSAKAHNCTPRDFDHWQFIVHCAAMAIHGVYILDVRVTIDEVIQAHYDWTCPQLKFKNFSRLAKRGCRAQICRAIGRELKVFHARDIIDLDLMWKRLGYYEEFPMD